MDPITPDSLGADTQTYQTAITNMRNAGPPLTQAQTADATAQANLDAARAAVAAAIAQAETDPAADPNVLKGAVSNYIGCIAAKKTTGPALTAAQAAADAANLAESNAKATLTAHLAAYEASQLPATPPS